MLSTNNEHQLSEADQQILLDVAVQSIADGLETRRFNEPEVERFPARLRRVQSSFVTLRISQLLRGCVGSISATCPLVVDVASNAYNASFFDVRFPALQPKEFADLDVHISVLSPLQRHSAVTLDQAIECARPGIDGVLIRLGSHVATFLPDVWETLPDPVDFFRHLMLKAGIESSVWDPHTEVSTYTTQRFSRSTQSERISMLDVG